MAHNTRFTTEFDTYTPPSLPWILASVPLSALLFYQDSIGNDLILSFEKNRENLTGFMVSFGHVEKVALKIGEIQLNWEK